MFLAKPLSVFFGGPSLASKFPFPAETSIFIFWHENLVKIVISVDGSASRAPTSVMEQLFRMCRRVVSWNGLVVSE